MEQFTISPEIRKMLIDYYRVTGLQVGMYDRNGKIPYGFPRLLEDFSELDYCEKCKLCSPRWQAECMDSDRDAFETARVSGASYIYKCEKGFYEAVIPIKCGEDTMLYLMIGQVRPSDMEIGDTGGALFDRYACESQEDFNRSEAQEAFEQMRTMDLKTFEAHVRLLELCAQKIGADESVRRNRRSVSLAVMQYVGNNLYNEITIGSAAKSLNYSVSYLSHAIAREMGTTFTRYVNACRVSEAKRLLRLTNMSVEKIATLLRYNGVAYFVRQFKRESGMTCTEYRALRGRAKTQRK